MKKEVKSCLRVLETRGKKCLIVGNGQRADVDESNKTRTTTNVASNKVERPDDRFEFTITATIIKAEHRR